LFFDSRLSANHPNQCDSGILHFFVRTNHARRAPPSIEPHARLARQQGELSVINHRHNSKEKTVMHKPIKPNLNLKASFNKGTNPISKTKNQVPRGYVEVIGAGSSPSEARFVRVKVNGKKLLIPANDLIGTMVPVYQRLQNNGASLVDTKDQRDLHTRIKRALQKEDTFPVATRLGWFREEDAQGKKGPHVFILPRGAIPENLSPVEVLLDEPDNDCYQRLQTKGTLEGAMEWLMLCKSNRCSMFGLSLACLGPVGSFLGLEHVGIALVSDAGKLKTTLASLLASFYGGDDDQINQLASGASLRQTGFNVEKLCAGRSGLILVLNEGDSIEGKDRRAKDNALLGLIKDVAEGRGKGRGTDPNMKLWYAPDVITFNESIVAVHKRIGRDGDFSFIDRMFDMFPPEGALCFFENLHGSRDPTAFRDRLVALLHAHYGVPGWEFIRRLVEWIKDDEAEFRKFVQARQAAYLQQARKIKAPGRDDRLHNKHASVYAAGCVGIELGILPFKRAALLAAILRCARDHVAYVARELGLGSGPVATNIDPFGTAIGKVGGYLRRSHPKMVNVRKPGNRVRSHHDHDSCLGYLGFHDCREEIWLPFPTFKRVVGGGRSAIRALLAELLRRGLLRAEDSPAGNREFSVKRDIPGIGRRRVIALLYAKKRGTSSPT
jgi:hypothetical protein